MSSCLTTLPQRGEHFRAKPSRPAGFCVKVIKWQWVEDLFQLLFIWICCDKKRLGWRLLVCWTCIFWEFTEEKPTAKLEVTDEKKLFKTWWGRAILTCAWLCFLSDHLFLFLTRLTILTMVALDLGLQARSVSAATSLLQWKILYALVSLWMWWFSTGHY